MALQVAEFCGVFDEIPVARNREFRIAEQGIRNRGTGNLKSLNRELSGALFGKTGSIGLNRIAGAWIRSFRPSLWQGKDRILRRFGHKSAPGNA
jgi:hypothetical protein